MALDILVNNMIPTDILEDIDLWDAKKIDEVIFEPDDGEEMGKGVRYYPEENVTIFFDYYFEGYFYDDFAEVLRNVVKGRASTEDVEKYFEDWFD